MLISVFKLRYGFTRFKVILYQKSSGKSVRCVRNFEVDVKFDVDIEVDVNIHFKVFVQTA